VIRPEWGSNNLAQGRAERRPGYCVRQREIALKGQNSLGWVVCVGTVCSAPSGQWALRAVEYPGQRFALPWAAMFKPRWAKKAKTQRAEAEPRSQGTRIKKDGVEREVSNFIMPILFILS